MLTSFYTLSRRSSLLSLSRALDGDFKNLAFSDQKPPISLTKSLRYYIILDYLLVFETDSSCMLGLIHQILISFHSSASIKWCWGNERNPQFFLPKSFSTLLILYKNLEIDSILFRFENPSSKIERFGVKSTCLSLICLCWCFEDDLIQNPQILFDYVRNPRLWIVIFWVNLIDSWVVFAGLWLNRLDYGLCKVTLHSQIWVHRVRARDSCIIWVRLRSIYVGKTRVNIDLELRYISKP